MRQRRRPGAHLGRIHCGPLRVPSRNSRCQFVRSEYDGSWSREWKVDRPTRASDYIGHEDNLPAYAKKLLCKVTSN